MSTPMLNPDHSETTEDIQALGSPWLRLFLVMAVPVLLLLVGITLNR